MKLYPALKDQTMKYPRAANFALDLGMVLMIISVGVLFCWGIGVGGREMFLPSIGGLATGFVAFVVSKYLASLKTTLAQPASGQVPHLTRVK